MQNLAQYSSLIVFSNLMKNMRVRFWLTFTETALCIGSLVEFTSKQSKLNSAWYIQRLTALHTLWLGVTTQIFSHVVMLCCRCWASPHRYQ